MMDFRSLRCLAVALPLVLAPAADCQIKVGSRTVNFHGFFSQGYANSNANNYLSMNTKEGTFEFTDGGMNASVSLTDKLFVGAQVYSRNIGNLTNGKVSLDWAFADYRVKDWFGIRAGKVKTVLGLLNDTQDMEFLHTWALLPQSAYPTDLRASTIAHVGADLYGEIALKKAGSLSYTAYAGTRPDDPRGGLSFRTAANNARNNAYKGFLTGMDIRWTTPVEGLTTGFSYSYSPVSADIFPAAGNTFVLNATQKTATVYGDYVHDRLHLSAEWRQSPLDLGFTPKIRPGFVIDLNGLYVAGAYRLHKKLELGSYYSRLVLYKNLPVNDPANHVFDKVIAARFDLTSFWNAKVEGHFIDGFGDGASAGFYRQDNRGGYKRNTNMLLLRTGVNF